MRDIRNVRDENLEYYRGQERQVSARLAILPKGVVKTKRIGNDIYHYLHYRKGESFKSDYIGREVPVKLREELKERKRLETELKRIREALRLMKSKSGKQADLTEPLRSILQIMTRQNLWESGLEIVGSWCFLLYQKFLPIMKYPLRTEDLDILVPTPYKGKSFDIGRYLKDLGFRQDFNPDGSMSFSGNMMRVDFLSPERGAGERTARFVPEIAVSPQSLRFMDILFEEPIVLNVARGVKAKVPSPAAFALHKYLIAARKKRKPKSEKDLRQATYAAAYVLSDAAESAKLKRLWSRFPGTWKKRVRAGIIASRDVAPLESGVFQRLLETLA